MYGHLYHVVVSPNTPKLGMKSNLVLDLVNSGKAVYSNRSKQCWKFNLERVSKEKGI